MDYLNSDSRYESIPSWLLTSVFYSYMLYCTQYSALCTIIFVQCQACPVF